MILADTSVWIDHLRAGDARLVSLLMSGQVLAHPFIIGELACGNLLRRDHILAALHDLPRATQAADDEVLFLINQHRLMGRGIGYVDAHLIASTWLTPRARLWTRDRSLAVVAERLALDYAP
ncbi:MAG: type II toxin-antitoxin system VapC family toxin [Alphaproteobacteria bacterium]|nr:type II toxin-antitoxin system VapC family toxin [Alphaproteobacteria bacterium]